MNDPNVIGVLGQPGRIAPASRDEWEAAYHEAGHAVVSQIFESTNDYGRVKIWRGEHNWTGFMGQNHERAMLTIEEIENVSLPSADKLTDKERDEQAREVWALMICCFAGAAAEAIFNHENLAAPSVRWHPSASTDAVIAGKLARHFFDNKRTEKILHRAAETAVTLCQVPAVWGAISELAKFLVDHGRGECSIYETSVIVRNHIANPLKVAPGEDWVMQFVRKQA